MGPNTRPRARTRRSYLTTTQGMAPAQGHPWEMIAIFLFGDFYFPAETVKFGRGLPLVVVSCFAGQSIFVEVVASC